MTQYFEVIVGIVTGITRSGKEKVEKEYYLVDAMSVVEAESKVVKLLMAESAVSDYKVVSVKESRIGKVI